MGPHPDAGEESRRSLPRDLLDLLMEAGTARDVAEGTVLCRRGDRADSTLVVEAGHVDVHVGDGAPPKRLGAGALVGELALLVPDGRRTATVVAGAGCRAIVIERSRFEAVLEREPVLACRALRHACAYLAESEGRLVGDLQRRNAELEAALDYLRRTREELDAAELRSQTDALCDIYNRRCFDRQLPRFMEADRSGGGGLALLLLDLDGFKPVNDRLGHAAGDAVLRAVAGVLRSHVRPTDLACRLGGDEFAVLLAPVGTSDGFDPARAARDLRRAIASCEVHLPDGVVRVGASIGGTLRREGDTPETLVARADAHLYAVKEAGRNRACWEGVVSEEG